MFKSKTTPADVQGVIAIAIVRVLLVFLLTGFLLFGSAGCIKYWRGWLFIALLFTLSMITLTFLAVRDPLLLEKRTRIREKEKVEKVYLRISLILVIIIFLIPGLDYRFNWCEVPVLVTIISAAVMVLGYAMFIYVLMVNRFASRIIEIQEGQKLVDSGPYSVVRHPMYSAALLIYGAAPLWSWVHIGH